MEPEHVALIAILAVLIPALAIGHKRKRQGVGWTDLEVSPAAQGSPEAQAAAERSYNEAWWTSALLRIFRALLVNLIGAVILLVIIAVISLISSFFGGKTVDLDTYSSTALILLGLFMAVGIAGAVFYKACETDTIKAVYSKGRKA